MPRLRIGVGQGDPHRGLTDHVLAGFDVSELVVIRAAVTRAADAAEFFVSEGIEPVMNRFNQAESMPDSLGDDRFEET